MSIIINGGSGSSSQDLRLTPEKTVLRSASVIVLKPSNSEDVDENTGGVASAVAARRDRTVFNTGANGAVHRGPLNRVLNFFLFAKCQVSVSLQISVKSVSARKQ